jgi:hypothetical protein
MVHAFEQGVQDFASLYAAFLDDDTRTGLASLAGQPATRFQMPVELWVRTVYAFALAYHWRSLNREHLLRSLTPLYLGRTASWVNEAGGYGAEQVERALDSLCETFERFKPQLVSAWREGRIRP